MDGSYEATPLDPRSIPRPRGSAEPVPSGPSVPTPRPGSSRAVVDTERGRVLARYARLMRSGRPEVCLPGRRERVTLGPRAAVARCTTRSRASAAADPHPGCTRGAARDSMRTLIRSEAKGNACALCRSSS